jgi:hypothetical protein
VVHAETSIGVRNPVEEIGALVREAWAPGRKDLAHRPYGAHGPDRDCRAGGGGVGEAALTFDPSGIGVPCSQVGAEGEETGQGFSPDDLDQTPDFDPADLELVRKDDFGQSWRG